MSVNVGCRIVMNTAEEGKIDGSLMERLSKIPVANIDDCMNRNSAVSQDIRPVNNANLIGRAFTVKVPQGDNLMFHKAMDLAQPGDVIVIDAGGTHNRAIFGEIMVKYCEKRGLAGVIVDGAIRDYDTISQLSFPVYASGVNPNGPYKNGPGEIGTTITFGGQVINPGDIILGDQDGIVVIKPEELEKLVTEAEAIFVKEDTIMAAIEKEGIYPRPWVDEILDQLGCEYIERKGAC